MSKQTISNGVVHKVPVDLRKIITLEPALHKEWENGTLLARNEWICWIESAKKVETRNRRLKILQENLIAGKRRPCCWAGCTHR